MKTKRISVLLLVTLLAFSLTGCMEVRNAENVTIQAFSALKAQNFAKFKELTTGENSEDDFNINEDENNSALIKKLFERFNYSLQASEKIDKETVVIKANITNVDATVILQELLRVAFANAFSGKEMTDEETNALFESVLSRENLQTVTTDVDITVKKVNKKWKVLIEGKLANALLGGLKERIESINNSFNE